MSSDWDKTERRSSGTRRNERDTRVRQRDSEYRDSSGRSATERRSDGRNVERRSRNYERRRQSPNSHASERPYRKRKPTFFETLLIGFQRLFSAIRRKAEQLFPQLKGKNGIRISMSILAFCAVAVVLAITVYAFTNKNAYKIEIDGTLIGIISKDKNITAEYLQDTAIAKLEAEAGTKIQVAETITLTPVHAGKKATVTVDSVIDSIRKEFTYKLEAAVITVDGVEMAIVKNAAEAQEILDRIISEYLNENAKLINSGFVEDVVTTARFVESDEIIEAEQAFSRLTVAKETEQTYQVKDGDNLGKISSENGITLNQLLEMNPDININTILNIGQNLTLVLPTPLLSVKTVEEVKYIEVAPKKTETITNSSQGKSWSKVVKQGKDGQQEVTAHITRINGFEQEKTITNTVITVPPEDEVIERGTL